MRFGYRKRQEFHRTVVKHVKYILQINLIRLLQYRWLTKIRVIQCAYRKYRLIKLARLQVLYVICLKSESLHLSPWPSLSNNLKYEILANFLIKALSNYSAKKCKYLYDIRMVNTKFTRNFSHWEMDALTNALGRSLKFKLPPPPKLLLYSHSHELIDYIKSETKKKIKKKVLKKSLILPDKKLF